MTSQGKSIVQAARAAALAWGPECLLIAIICHFHYPRPLSPGFVALVAATVICARLLRAACRPRKARDLAPDAVDWTAKPGHQFGMRTALRRLPAFDRATTLRLLARVSFTDNRTQASRAYRIAIDPDAKVQTNGEGPQIPILVFPQDNSPGHPGLLATGQLRGTGIVVPIRDIAPPGFRHINLPVVFDILAPTRTYSITAPADAPRHGPHPAGLTNELIAAIRRIDNNDLRQEAMDIATRRISSITQLNKLRSDLTNLIGKHCEGSVAHGALALINARIDKAEHTYAS